MKKLLILPVCIFALFLGGCGAQAPSADQQLNQKQEQIMKESVTQIGMPNIVNFQEKKLAKMIFELRDQENLKTYAYIMQYGKLIYIGQAIGYGLPYATQYTNPEKADGNQYGYYTLPQADPNGLFMPSQADATWLMLIDKKTGEPRPVYIEERLIISPFPLSI